MIFEVAAFKCRYVASLQPSPSCVAQNIPVSFHHDYENLVGLLRAPEGPWHMAMENTFIFNSWSFGLSIEVLCCFLLDGVSTQVWCDVAGSPSKRPHPPNIWLLLKLEGESQSKFDVNLYSSSVRKKMILIRFSFKKMTSEYDFSLCRIVYE